MTLPAAATHCVFIEHAQPRSGLSRVEDRCFRAAYGFDKLTRQCRDSTQPLQQVQNYALAGEDHPRIVPDHGDLLSAMQSHAVENLRMAGNFVMRDHCAIEHCEHVKNAGCCSNASQNTILLGKYGADSALVGINAGVAG